MDDASISQRFDYPNEQSKDLFNAILALESIEDCERFFRDLCTMQELKEMTERWEIAKMIWQGYPYRVITEKTGASSTTIARVAHWVTYGEGGYQKACKQHPQK
ncbi:hypothetical protein AUJ46_04255 [Candidatus Peregrinibacteria bacterium CG1_02_54_53]|nr:MAG: hypothetical protein AUJ46_04255 [Candidatus Peregrinibacteria bacterium CG1_02_54_53]